MHKYLKIFEPLQALFSGAQKKQRAEAENHEIQFECKKTLFCLSGWTDTGAGCPERLWSPYQT